MLTVVSNNPDDPSIDKISVWTTPEKKELVPLNQPTTIGMTRRLGKPEMVMTGLWIEGTKPGDIENEYTITLQVDWDVNGNRETKDYVPVDITVTPVMPPSAIISDLKPRPVKFAGDNVNVYWLVICK